jgi:hypothetical protein
MSDDIRSRTAQAAPGAPPACRPTDVMASPTPVTGDQPGRQPSPADLQWVADMASRSTSERAAVLSAASA